MGGLLTNLLERAGQKFAESTPYFESGMRSLQKIGPLTNILHESLQKGLDNIGVRNAKVAEFYIPQAEKVRAKAPEFIADLQRKARATDPEVAKLADYSRIVGDALYHNEFPKVGIKVGPPRPDDFPRMWNPSVFEGVGKEKAIQHLMNTGQAASTRDAEKILGEIGRPDKVHTMESARQLNLPGYREDVAVPFDHIVKSIRRVEWAKLYGPNFEKLDYLLDQIRSNHGHAAYKLADFVSSKITGRPIKDSWLTGAGPDTGKIASFEMLQHLSLAFINHTGQFLNASVVSSRYGLNPTIKALGRAMRDDPSDFALRNIGFMHHVITDFRRLAGAETTENLGSKMLRQWTPFAYIDRLRRGFSSFAGAEFAQQAALELKRTPGSVRAMRNLRLVGLDPAGVAQRGLTPDDLLTAGKRMSDITQFESNALTLPPKFYSKEPILKMAYLFKQYFFHQSRFVKDQVLKPAFIDRDLKPLLYMATLFPTFGEIVADMREFARKGNLKDRPHHLIERMIDNYAAIGGFGIWHDLMYSIASGQVDAIWHFAAGPALSEVPDIVNAAKQPHGLEKKALRAIPLVGPYAAHKLFPPKAPVKGPLQRGEITKRLNQALNVELP